MLGEGARPAAPPLDAPLSTNISIYLSRCNRFVSGPVFCGSGSSYELTGLPGSSSSWCTAGAYTRYLRSELGVLGGRVGSVCLCLTVTY